MKKLMIVAAALALVGAQVQTAKAGDRGWATAGKILTGVAIGAAVATAVDAHASYEVTYAPAPVYGPPPVAYVPAPVVVTPPPVVYAPAPVVCSPPVVYAARPVVVCAPAPVVVYRAPLCYTPGWRGYHRPHGRW